MKTTALVLFTALAVSRPSWSAQTPGSLTLEQASRFAQLSLECMDKEFPNRPGQTYSSDEEMRPPRKVHPIFKGCYDWHSAVHGHWALVRLLRLFPDTDLAKKIEAKLDAHFTSEFGKTEAAFFDDKENATWERPYGWAWFLRLMSELRLLKHPKAEHWAAALSPLESKIRAALVSYLERLPEPLRYGEHPNTAFALSHAWDYAEQAGDTKLLDLLRSRGAKFYAQDRDCPVTYEPSGEDFISGCLAEADFMRKALPRAEYVKWAHRFLPLKTGQAPKFLHPIEPGDLTDKRMVHLVGLNFHRAWAFAGAASALPKGDPLANLLGHAAEEHEKAGLDLMERSKDYGATHWLASFVIFEMTEGKTPKAVLR